MAETESLPAPVFSWNVFLQAVLICSAVMLALYLVLGNPETACQAKGGHFVSRMGLGKSTVDGSAVNAIVTFCAAEDGRIIE